MNADSALQDGAIAIWLAQPGDLPATSQLTPLYALLSKQECQTASRFVNDRGLRQYVLTRIMTRSVLANCNAISPASVAYQYNPWGRPELTAESNPRALRFNISHTPDLIALCVTRRNDIGLDTEPLSRSSQIQELAARLFSTLERRYLDTVPREKQAPEFVRLWTLKEAYLKARGHGLSLPLHDFSLITEQGKTTLHCEPHFDAAGEDWCFASFSPVPGHILALAVRHTDPCKNNVQFSHWELPSS